MKFTVIGAMIMAIAIAGVAHALADVRHAAGQRGATSASTASSTFADPVLVQRVRGTTIADVHRAASSSARASRWTRTPTQVPSTLRGTSEQ